MEITHQTWMRKAEFGANRITNTKWENLGNMCSILQGNKFEVPVILSTH